MVKNKKLINLWLGPNHRLEVNLNPIKPKSTKKSLAQQYRGKISGIALIVIGVLGIITISLATIRLRSPPTPVHQPATTEQITPQSTEKEQPAQPFTMSASDPTRLRITDINVDTSFVQLEQHDDGTMQVPKSPEVAGWYRLGPTPGELGPAIIVGHVDSSRGPAIFWRISQLELGQKIEVDRTDGSTAIFAVSQVSIFDQNYFPTEEVYGNIDYAGLRIITCGGQYIRDIERYTHNVVVFASLVTEE